MAELTDSKDNVTTSSCCAPEQQATCCEPSEKSSCCSSDSSSCGCSAGQSDEPTRSGEEIREVVRDRYAAAAKSVAAEGGASCCGPGAALSDEQAQVFGASLYGEGERAGLPDTATMASLGCGNPTAVAELRPGETVLDLGSGGGIDVLLSARRVEPGGKAYGLDMTDEMLALARQNQAKAGVENVEWLRGEIESIPLPAESVDVVISNCVINLSADKSKVLAEAARVLRPGGRLAIFDVVADDGMDEATRNDVEQWTGCVAGALTRAEFERKLRGAGFDTVEIEETHRVHDQAASAIIRARKPVAAAGSQRP